MDLRRHQAAGLEYLGLVTTLLQRGRRADPSVGVWEAADLQWWWRRDQHPDPARQTFWLDDDGEPVAAVVLTDWGGTWGCDLISALDPPSAVIEVAWWRALELLEGDAPVEIVARDDDESMLDALGAAGFRPTGETTVATVMPSHQRPDVGPLADGFRLVARDADGLRPHHMIARNGQHVADRLAECSLYRPDLDLVVRAPTGAVAAYGLFWHDPVTGVGLVEPMRAEDSFQRLGLARHVLTEGLARLAGLGCTSFKVSYIDGNEAAKRLYLGTGFTPCATSRTYRSAVRA